MWHLTLFAKWINILFKKKPLIIQKSDAHINNTVKFLVRQKPIEVLHVDVSYDPNDNFDINDYRDLIENNRKLREQNRVEYERNLKGVEALNNGDYETAIRYFEENVKDDFEGNCPYDRLIDLYCTLKRYADALRIAEKAIKVFAKITSNRADVPVKLKRFKGKLIEVKLLEKRYVG
jgi:tetratricopeptide (TPR) repeat protein